MSINGRSMIVTANRIEENKMSQIRSILLLLLLTGLASGQQVVDPELAKLDQSLGQTGKILPGNVQKYTWPRTDLHVSLDGVSIQTGLALGSWGAFQKGSKEGELMTMGDLVLLPSEVNPVIEQLQAAGIDVLAIHNHLFGETPEIVYVHFEGHGSSEALAKGLKAAVEKTGTPAPALTQTAPIQTAPADEKAFETIQTILGRKGNIAGKVLQIGIPRKEKIEEDGMEIPSSMGMANSMNFQISGDRIAATGDFVLIADEVNPVIKELQAHGIQVTALHTHMLHDSPHLFFMHFWALNTPEKVAEGLNAALSRVNVK